MLEDASADSLARDVGEYSARLSALTRINADDMLSAFGLGQVRRGRRLLESLCHLPAERFARKVLAYDEVVGRQGLADGGAWALAKFAPRWTVLGQANLPKTGPLLVVANHPGLYDTTLLFAAIARSDLRVIAADRPFLRALPNTARHLLFIGSSTSSRLGLIRAAARHLERGGALLTFPAGEIEPDPSVLPGAVDALEKWSASLDLLIRLAPRLTIVPAVVSGVLSGAAQRHPLTRLRRSEKGRQWLGAMLQVIAPTTWSVEPAVTFGRPVRSREPQLRQAGGREARLGASDGAVAEARRQVLEEVRRLIDECQAAGTSRRAQVERTYSDSSSR